MGDLYRIATSVIVFLSEESDDSDLAIDFAEKAPMLRTISQVTARNCFSDNLKLPLRRDYSLLTLLMQRSS